MAGQIRRMIDSLLEQRSKGNPTIRVITETKLILKGVSPDRFTTTSADDEGVMARVRAVAAELGIVL
jgi:hypothetical protein